jgi:hypothetical protein
MIAGRFVLAEPGGGRGPMAASTTSERMLRKCETTCPSQWDDARGCDLHKVLLL